MKIIILICLLLFLSVKSSLSEEENDLSNFKESLIHYKYFSGIITQIQNNQVSIGKINVANERIRLDYIDPSNITIVIKPKKGMYYNSDLDEVEYFNTKNTQAMIFYELFYNDFFLLDFEEVNKKQLLIYKKKQNISDEDILVEIIFEKKPILLREIILKGENTNLKIGLSDHDFNPIFEKKFFSMANPTLR